jgi:hypothetical protein
MTEDDTPQRSLPACGRTWDGIEPWPEMAVLIKETINGPEGPLPAYSTEHHCRTCRTRLTGERLGSVAGADEWLRRVLATREAPSEFSGPLIGAPRSSHARRPAAS